MWSRDGTEGGGGGGGVGGQAIVGFHRVAPTADFLIPTVGEI